MKSLHYVALFRSQSTSVFPTCKRFKRETWNQPQPLPPGSQPGCVLGDFNVVPMGGAGRQRGRPQAAAVIFRHVGQGGSAQQGRRRQQRERCWQGKRGKPPRRNRCLLLRFQGRKAGWARSSRPIASHPPCARRFECERANGIYHTVPSPSTSFFYHPLQVARIVTEHWAKDEGVAHVNLRFTEFLRERSLGVCFPPLKYAGETFPVLFFNEFLLVCSPRAAIRVLIFLSTKRLDGKSLYRARPCPLEAGTTPVRTQVVSTH